MADDIVTRLREVACDNRGCGNEPHCRLCDAADEIERLRAEVAYLKTPCPRCDYEEEN